MSPIASATMTVFGLAIMFAMAAWAMNTVAQPYKAAHTKAWKWGVCLRFFGWGLHLERVSPKPRGTTDLPTFHFAGLRLVLLRRRA